MSNKRPNHAEPEGTAFQEDLQPYLQCALDAAHQAGAIIRAKSGQSVHIDLKGRINLVTEVDMASEKLIRTLISNTFPQHCILGEEGGELSCADFVSDPQLLAAATATDGHRYRWIVDPLDGTTNFAQGYPFFSVSIALEIDGQVAVGVVYDPTHDDTFQAVAGGGAQLNGRPIHVSPHSELVQSLLVTGFPYNVGTYPDIHLKIFSNILGKARGVRRDGSAALDLCYVACGRYDAFWELGLSPWDMAAGTLIVREAGGRISDYSGQPHHLNYRDMLASNSLIHDEVLNHIRPALADLRTSPYWVERS